MNKSATASEISTLLDEAKQFYLVGIKGVGMTSLAQCLTDMGKKVTGADVADEFVTQSILDSMQLGIEVGFTQQLPEDTQVVIYSGAHSGKANPLVKQAQARNLPVFSHAEVLGWMFNQKQGLAVCGVGGKSTISAMLAWTLLKLKQKPSFSVGVGKITELTRTGAFQAKSKYFVAEADEYADNPSEAIQGEKLVPRLSFLQPYLIICSNLQFDHPDVYQDFTHTKQVFMEFFHNLKPNGFLICNFDDKQLFSLTKKFVKLRKDMSLLGFGHTAKAQYQLTHSLGQTDLSQASLKFENQTYPLKLLIPGEHNLMNAAAVVTALHALGFDMEQIINELAKFPGVGRRLQLVKQTAEHIFYDDYAHHPTEIVRSLQALKQHHPNLPLVVVFQPHTTSRTKSLLDSFAESFTAADQVILLPIFTSAREKMDASFSTRNLIEKIKQHHPAFSVTLEPDIAAAATQIKKLSSSSVVVTLGAGDVYLLHNLV